MLSYISEDEVEPRATRQLAYEKKFDLTDIHEKRITGIAISPDGRYIATCSEDCSVTLWLVETGEATHRILARSAVLCATWPTDPGTLICGTTDGTLLTITMSSPYLVVSGFEAHSKPIEHLVVNVSSRFVPRNTGSGVPSARRRLASAGHDEIKVWLLQGEEWVPEQVVRLPPPTSQSDKKPFVVTALQWVPHGDEADDELLVAYLFHGIYCTRLEATGAQQVQWSIHLSLCGPCSISPRGSIVAANIVLGFEVYEYPAGTRAWKPPPPLSKVKALLPVQFVHDGDYLLFGCHDGKVRMHSSASGEHFFTLRHEGWGLIQALDAFRDEASGTFLIVCASGESTRPVARVWQGRVVDKSDHGTTHLTHHR
ncbi:hypothetical protein FOMPIDRAFT_1164056 [Fomitopsis schrenkii]|uniref:Uncharacterized protein n=1 Tax=Fomitopsis schrenkii TaxID=2126942 RepID=S8FCT8_FOMSC|nr:hypothetical protein FOMPIDRAFT_1164056 [Fomitopsis schrenkii]